MPQAPFVLCAPAFAGCRKLHLLPMSLLFVLKNNPMNPYLLTYANLNRHSAEIRHFSSTRKDGVSTGEFATFNLGNYTDDLRDNIETNRQALCAELQIGRDNLITVHQTHSASVKIIDEAVLSLPPSQRTEALYSHDAMICRIPGICIAVNTADCVPVLLFDPETKTVAAIHSGWKSTVQNITQATIGILTKQFGSNPAGLVAAIGPCIGGKVYEVGTDLYERFETEGFDMPALFAPKANGKYLFDIRKAVAGQLRSAGVSDIEVSSHCTYSEPELFFSARRQSIHSGRMLSGIMII
jgi:YfiH family protein